MADRYFLKFSYLRMFKSRIEEWSILYFFGTLGTYIYTKITASTKQIDKIQSYVRSDFVLGIFRFSIAFVTDRKVIYEIHNNE